MRSAAAIVIGKPIQDVIRELRLKHNYYGSHHKFTEIEDRLMEMEAAYRKHNAVKNLHENQSFFVNFF